MVQLIKLYYLIKKDTIHNIVVLYINTDKASLFSVVLYMRTANLDF